MNSKGYLLGKLFAQLERAGALDILDYQNASVAPTDVMIPSFARLAQLGKTDAIVETMNELPEDALNGRELSPADQADFPLGYYHQKARWLRAEEQPDEEEAFTTHLLVRLEPALKKWTLEHGGSKLVRQLLRTERNRHE